MKNTKKFTWLWLLLSLAIIFADQITKYWAQEYLVQDQPYELFSWLNFDLAFNPGAAFRTFGDYGTWHNYFLAGVSIVASISMTIWLLRLKTSQIWLSFSLALIIGGAVGNLIDRVRYEYVVDFIDFHIRNWHFATFNVADSAISVGAFLLIAKLILGKKE